MKQGRHRWNGDDKDDKNKSHDGDEEADRVNDSNDSSLGPVRDRQHNSEQHQQRGSWSATPCKHSTGEQHLDQHLYSGSSDRRPLNLTPPLLKSERQVNGATAADL